MVISSTSADEVSIHAVSPLFGVGAGGVAGAGAWANAGSIASNTNAAKTANPAIRPKLPSFISTASKVYTAKSKCGGRSDRAVVGLAGAHADGVLDRRDEDLAVADLPRAGGANDGLDGLVHAPRRGHDLDLHFRQETHRVFG